MPFTPFDPVLERDDAMTPAPRMPDFGGLAAAAAPAPAMPSPMPAAQSPTKPPMGVPAFGAMPQAGLKTPGFLQAMLPAALSALMSRGNPEMVGAGLNGFLKGQQLRRAQMEDDATRQQRERMEQAEFYTRALTQMDTLDDPVAFQQWKRAVTPRAMALGIDPEVFQYSDAKRQKKAQQDAESYIGRLRKVYGATVDDPAWRAGVSVPMPDQPKPVSLEDLYQLAMASPMRDGKPIAPPPPINQLTPNTPDEQAYAKAATERGYKSFGEMPFAEQQTVMKAVADAKRQAPSVTPGSFEDYLSATPERQAQIRAARKGYGQADDRPDSGAALRDINLQIAQLRLESLKKQGTGLSPPAERQVLQQASQFDSLPVVKNTQVMSEAVDFARSIDPNTKNPADDQALIYAFAKAMDPNSVVREGEYATVQKYAQSWAQTYKFNVERIGSNVAFLAPEARANMKATILSRFAAAQRQYEPVRKSFADRINKITGGTDGESYLTDYGASFPSSGKVNPFRKAP